MVLSSIKLILNFPKDTYIDRYLSSDKFNIWLTFKKDKKAGNYYTPLAFARMYQFWCQKDLITTPTF